MKKIIFLAASVIFLSLIILVLPLAIGFAKTGDQTTVLGRDYSLLTKKQIISRLNTDFPLPVSLTLQHQDRHFSLPTASISAAFNSDQLASDMLFRRLNRGFLNYLRAFFTPKDFALELNFNSAALDSEIQKIASQIDRPFVPSEIILDNKTVQVKTGQLGTQTNQFQLHQLIINNLTRYQLNPIVVPVDPLGHLPTDSQVQSALAAAKNLSAKSLTLKYADQTTILDPKVLVSWVGFDGSCRLDKISDYVATLAQSIKKDPVDAVFKFENNQVVDFQSSQKGYSLQTEETKNLLCHQFSSALPLDLPLTYQDPKITTADANNLGIKELLGRGTSSFRHSSSIRNFNIAKGASIVNRILVAPGEEFSFLKNLGEVTLDNGFKKAYVIKKGKTELDVGGGICQVSTTLFRAMFNAGLDITARTAHAYRVQYYEEDSRPGFDATVFIPSPDLKFKNDTGHYVLIQSQYDGKNKKLTYEIYGTSDGRQVEISNYRQWDATPAPPDVYLDDPTLPPGKIVKDESRVPGLKTAFDWKVTRNGEIIHQKTFQSSYVPWAAVYRRGPSL